jgi:hypothetical protein
VAAGTYSLTARATNSANLTTTSAAVTVTVNAPPPPAPPVVSLTAPAGGSTFTAPATITLSANASTATGSISKVDFFSGSTLIGTDTTAPYSFSWTNVAAGSYALSARATNSSSLTAQSSTANVTVNAASPVMTSVSLTSPANNATFTAPATVTLNATASTTSGSISKVDFYSGSTLLGTDTTSPYSFTWNNVAAGTYSLTARTTTSGGQTAQSSAVSITVSTASVTLTTAIFTPSADNATNVNSYNLEIFTSGSNPSSASPVGSQNLGKPSIVNGEMSANIASLINSLPSGSYFATVTAIGPGGSTRSAASNTFTK